MSVSQSYKDWKASGSDVPRIEGQMDIFECIENVNVETASDEAPRADGGRGDPGPTAERTAHETLVRGVSSGAVKRVVATRLKEKERQ